MYKHLDGSAWCLMLVQVRWRLTKVRKLKYRTICVHHSLGNWSSPGVVHVASPPTSATIFVFFVRFRARASTLSACASATVSTFTLAAAAPLPALSSPVVALPPPASAILREDLRDAQACFSGRRTVRKQTKNASPSSAARLPKCACAKPVPPFRRGDSSQKVRALPSRHGRPARRFRETAPIGGLSRIASLGPLPPLCPSLTLPGPPRTGSSRAEARSTRSGPRFARTAPAGPPG